MYYLKLVNNEKKREIRLLLFIFKHGFFFLLKLLLKCLKQIFCSNIMLINIKSNIDHRFL